jgi:protein SCO1
MKNMNRTLPLCLTLLFACAWLAACQKAGDTSQPPDAAALKRYELKGKVVSLEPEKKRVKVEHEAIPNFMEAMTMSFVVKDEQNYGRLQAGAQIHATLVYNADDNRSWLENLKVIEGDAPASGS